MTIISQQKYNKINSYSKLKKKRTNTMKLAPKSDFVLSLGFVTNYLQLTWGKILNLPKDWTGQSLK